MFSFGKKLDSVAAEADGLSGVPLEILDGLLGMLVLLAIYFIAFYIPIKSIGGVGAVAGSLALGKAASAGSSGAATKPSGGGSGGGGAGGSGGGGVPANTGSGGGEGEGSLSKKQISKNVAGNFATGAGVGGTMTDMRTAGGGAKTVAAGASTKASGIAGSMKDRAESIKDRPTTKMAQEFYNDPQREKRGHAFDNKPGGKPSLDGVERIEKETEVGQQGFGVDDVPQQSESLESDYGAGSLSDYGYGSDRIDRITNKFADIERQQTGVGMEIVDERGEDST